MSRTYLPSRIAEIDMKEMLKKQMMHEGDRYGSQRPSLANDPPKIIGFEDSEIYFESTNSDGTSNYSTGEIKWSIPAINNLQDIKNCIEFALGEFYFPKIYGAPGSPEFFYHKKLYMQLTSAPASQSVLGANGNRFHFEFDIENLTGQAVKLKPTKSSFFFTKPITTLADFNVQFMVPSNNPILQMRKVPLPSDTVTATLILAAGLGFNPVRFSLPDVSVLGPPGAVLAPGIAVFMTAFNPITASPAVVNAVNSVDGIFVTNIVAAVGNVPGYFEIGSINAAVAFAPAPPESLRATVYIPKNRIAFPVRFTSVCEVATNYINITHS